MDKRIFRFIWIIISLLLIKEGNNTDTYQLNHVYAKYGDPVILKCLNNTDATAWDGPSTKSSYKYTVPYASNYKISQQLPNAKNLMMVGDISVGEYNLKIINLTQNEEGYYKCYVHKGNTVFEISYVLKIKDRPSVRFDKNEHNITVYEGRPFSITCFSDSNPVITEIFWKTNGKMIGRYIKYTKSVALNIWRIERHHEGRYTCIAKNHNGFGQKSINITVLCSEVKNERTNTAVIVSISVITAVSILLGVFILHIKGKLRCRRHNANLRNSGLDPDCDIRVQLAVQNPNYNNHSRNEISGTGHNAQVRIREAKTDHRMELADGYVNWQGNTVLNYTKIDFTPGSPESQFVIHEKKNVTKYSDIVLPVASTSVVLNE